MVNQDNNKKENGKKLKPKWCRQSGSPTSSNCLTRSLICDIESGGLSALTADISKHG